MNILIFSFGRNPRAHAHLESTPWSRPLLISSVLLACMPCRAQSGGTVNFCNNNSARIVQSGTGNPVSALDGVRAALYWAPAGGSNFVQTGSATSVGVPLPGLFAGGTRTTGGPGGGTNRFLVRAWGGGYDSYEEALQHSGVLVGESALAEMATGDSGATPPTPPASLIAGGFASFSLSAITSSPPPVITAQPAHQTISPGESVTFAVTASSGSPLSYQWQFNGINLDGETGSSLTLTNVTSAMAGHYSVIISNAGGMVTSSMATLSVMNLNFFPVLTLFGVAGDHYRIDYVEDPASTNWQVLGNVTMPESSCTVMDTNSPNVNKRFYRAVYLP